MSSINRFKKNACTCKFSKCNQEAEFSCKCSESFWCKNHIKTHQISSTKVHLVNSLLIGVYDLTKKAIMKVLAKERSKLREMNTKIQEFISENNFSFKAILSVTLKEITNNIILIDQICVELMKTKKIHKFEKKAFLKALILSPQEGIRVIKKLLNWNWSFENDDFYITTLKTLKSKQIEIQEFENWILSLETFARDDDIETINKSLKDEIDLKFNLNFNTDKLLIYLCISEKIKSSYQEYLERYENINRVLKRYIDNLSYDTNNLYHINFKDDITGLWTINIETRLKEWQKLPTPYIMGYRDCAVKLPNSELFCFGGSNINTGAAYILDLQSWTIRKYLPSTNPRIHSGGIFYKNAVYVFGGQDRNSFDCRDVEKFDLEKNKWVIENYIDTIYLLRAVH
ncbi:unnamed protein product [Blepharisma stoltei]|uniref:Uncharacterized protein n=1 Tax=Blepharisma stoltei TaxID=1481888 RepID=A0AAU9ITS3_9CILI|nr:unnamed protein product [Blepharisma stoltei]